jgi:hypothetical protein
LACVFWAPLLGTNREVEPAVGESFVVMFEEQFASREHDSTVPCPTRVVADAGAWRAWQYVLPAGVAQRMTRAGEYVRAVVAQRHECAAGGTPVASDGRVVFALVSKSRSCRSTS